jgi:chemotaxis protein MotB
MRRSTKLALLFVLSGCGVSQQQYTAKQAEAQKYKLGMQTQTTKIAALERRNEALEAQLGTLQDHVAATNTEAATTGAQKAQLEARTAELRAETGALKDRQAIVLNEQLLFHENSAKLTPEMKRSLDAAADAIAQLRDKGLIVTAYTDDSEGGGRAGTTKRWHLSTARATEVAKYLVGRGVDPRLIGVAGFGEGRPVAPNDSLSNRALNRRAELVLAPTEFNLKSVDVAPATVQP